MGRQQYEQFCLRFSPDNPQHVKVLRILNNLDRDLYKSKTQFIMEAIESYICRLSEGMETADEDEEKKYVTSEELEVMENRIQGAVSGFRCSFSGHSDDCNGATTSGGTECSY